METTELRWVGLTAEEIEALLEPPGLFRADRRVMTAARDKLFHALRDPNPKLPPCEVNVYVQNPIDYAKLADEIDVERLASDVRRQLVRHTQRHGVLD